MQYVRQLAFALSVMAVCFAAGAANSQPAAEVPPTAEELGYSIVLEENPSHLKVVRNAEEIWSLQSWMISVDPVGDLTGDGLPNLLVHEASSRSFRSIQLLELGPDGVQVLWQLSGHVTELNDAEAEIYRRLEAGESLAIPPGSPIPAGLRRMDEGEAREGTGEPAVTEPTPESEDD